MPKAIQTVTCTGVVLTREQQVVLDRLFRDRHEKRVQTLGGLAGCGKSTVLSAIVDRVLNEDEQWGICAFTGKAANQLRRKGVAEASTIHSLIYQVMPVEEEEWDERTETWVTRKKMIYDLKETVPYTGFIVDEGSMISGRIDRDLASFGKPIIYIGDHGQLEPIGENPGIMNNPMYRLETIHRNAGDVARFADHLRQGKNARDFPSSENVNIASVFDIFVENPSVLLAVDQVICAFNKTRCQINCQIRGMQGREVPLHLGEKIMCLRNNRGRGLFNGMQGSVVKLEDAKPVSSKSGEAKVVPLISFQADDLVIEEIYCDPDQFGSEKVLQPFGGGDNGMDLFDYAYCITCHKSVSDEFDDVIVVEQRCPRWSHQRWAYTAASRAKKNLVWVV